MTEAKLSLDDEWHRLYEAAAMSGDDEVFKDVSRALMCANPIGIPGGKLIEYDDTTYCHYLDGSRHVRGDFSVLTTIGRSGTLN